MKKWLEGRCEKCGTEFSVPLRMLNGHFIECLSCGGFTPIIPHKKNQEPPRLISKPRNNKKGDVYINGGYLKARR